MKKLLFRFFVICTIDTILISVIVLVLHNMIDEKNTLHAIELSIHGKYYTIADYLKNFRPNEWQSELTKVHPKNSSVINVLPIDSLPLNEAEKTKVKNSELVYQFIGKDTAYPAVIYKKINNSSYAFQEYLDYTPEEKTDRFLSWVPEMIIIKLNNMPKNNWPAYLDEISKQFGMPVAIVNSDSLSNEQNKLLQKNKWFIDWPNKKYPAKTLYYHFPKEGKLLKFGPTPYQFIDIHEDLILFFSALIAILLIIFAMAYKYLRSVEKIKQLADAYGHWEFDSDIKINKGSSLYSLYENLRAMAQRIKNLVCSQKELMNAVSHELRTPLSRLQFSLEMLSSAKSKEEIHERIAVMKEDINELDDLVSEILAYSKISSLSYLDKKMVSLNAVVKDLTIKYDGLVSHIDADVVVLADEKYLHRALQNIIQNAFRFAKSIVKVSLLNDKIIIEDDGPGIPNEDREKLFEPFMQLNADTNHFGLGLAIVKKIIQQHGWEIYISDSSLGGAKIVIIFSV